MALEAATSPRLPFFGKVDVTDMGVVLSIIVGLVGYALAQDASNSIANYIKGMLNPFIPSLNANSGPDSAAMGGA